MTFASRLLIKATSCNFFAKDFYEEYCCLVCNFHNVEYSCADKIYNGKVNSVTLKIIFTSTDRKKKNLIIRELCFKL